eukprot:s5349_g2.t1
MARTGDLGMEDGSSAMSDAQDQDINDSGKLVELFNLLRGIVARREKVLVFFCRTVTSKLLAALMEREFGVRPGILQGDTPHNERERIVREFKAMPIPGEPQSQVLLLSVWVGAVGLNLPEARWVVHVERVWNPALERQATSRAHRLTSRKPVKAYCLFMQDTLEERKASVLSSKYRLSTNVMEALDLEQDEVGEEGNSEELGKAHGEELRALLGGSSSSSETPLEQSWQNSPEDEAALAEADPEESKEPSSDEEDDDPGKPKGDRCPLYPALARLRPLRFKRKMWVGKYGNPEDEELWDPETRGRETRSITLLASSSLTDCLPGRAASAGVEGMLRSIDVGAWSAKTPTGLVHREGAPGGARASPSLQHRREGEAETKGSFNCPFQQPTKPHPTRATPRVPARHCAMLEAGCKSLPARTWHWQGRHLQELVSKDEVTD